jgi:DNA-binding response OmpR family regulator
VRLRGKQPARLLAILANAPGKVVHHAALIEAIWGDDADGGPLSASKQVQVLMCYLRKSLAAGRLPVRIVTHRGVGYELVLLV